MSLHFIQIIDSITQIWWKSNHSFPNSAIGTSSQRPFSVYRLKYLTFFLLEPDSQSMSKILYLSRYTKTPLLLISNTSKKTKDFI